LMRIYDPELEYIKIYVRDHWLKVIGNGTIRYIAFEFLFVFHCNYGRILCV